MKTVRRYTIITFIAIVVFAFVNPPICFMILGLLFIYLALKFLVLLNDLETYGLDAEGKVVEYKLDADGYKIPIIEFKTQSGEGIKGTPASSLSGYIGPYRFSNKPNDVKVNVRYNPKEPEVFFLKGDEGEGYFLLIVVGCLGLILIVACFYQLLFT